jgi:xanthine/uracil/vitamin C permease (AzgA family)
MDVLFSWGVRAAMLIGIITTTGLFEIVFVFLFVNMFDNIGTVVAVGKKAKLFDDEIGSRASTASFSPMPPPLSRTRCPAPPRW